MKTLYAIGTRVSLTPWAFAHVSIMSSEASWMGFFMYPTLSSRSCAWAEKRPVERASPIAVAAQSPMKRRSSGIDTSSNRAVFLDVGGARPSHTFAGAEAMWSPAFERSCCHSSPETPPVSRAPRREGAAVAAARRLRAIRRSRPSGVFPTLISLYDFRMWRSLASVVTIAGLAVVHANAPEPPAQCHRGQQITVSVGAPAAERHQAAG